MTAPTIRAVTCHAGVLDVVDLPAPRPAKGQLVIDVARPGICGSALHARTQADELQGVMDEIG